MLYYVYEYYIGCNDRCRVLGTGILIPFTRSSLPSPIPVMRTQPIV
jgi:hypothetical protein